MKKSVIAIFTAAILLTSCKESKKTDVSNSKDETTTSVSMKEQEKEEKTAICLLEKLSVRAEAAPKGKWLTSMSLGEQISLTGEEKVNDSTKKLYYKVRLIDGKEGWTPARFLAVEGVVGVLLGDAYMYKRPDLLTKTEKKYSKMDIIASTESKGDWLKVKGKRHEGEYIEEGWLKSSNISSKEVDIAVAKYMALAMKKETMGQRIEALQDIIDNPDLSSSSLLTNVEDKIEDYKSKNVSIDADEAVENN